VEFSVCHPSPPNTYSYVREESSGSTRKFVENHWLFIVRVLPTKFLHYVPYTCGALMGWRNFSKTVENKFLQPMCSGCISLSVCLFVCLFVCLLSMKTRRIFVGVKIRVSTWSFLSVIHPLWIPIPMYEKKIWVQQENLYKISYLFMCISNLKFLHYIRRALMGTRNLSMTTEKSSSSPCIAGVFLPMVVRFFFSGVRFLILRGSIFFMRQETLASLNLEEHSEGSPHVINFSVRLSFCPSGIPKHVDLHVGIKIRMFTWSFLSALHPLRMPIPMCEKKIWIQQENP
jgi:hypothetical protein